MSETIISAIKAQLNALIDPYSLTPMTDAKALQSVDVGDQSIIINMVKAYPIDGVRGNLTANILDSLNAIPNSHQLFDGHEIQVNLTQKITSHSVQQGVKPIVGVKNVIAVASGKGGVGKSTVSANLALALSQAGAKVALLDADIYGPSQPAMLGVGGKPEMLENKKILPHSKYGLSIMSIGFMVEQDAPMIWRGPMLTQALEQMVRGTQWDDIDYMIIDLPPGTGDIQLTLSQRVPVSGSVIVTTPQDIALLDARKAYKMFEKVAIPVLGIIENMSTHICTKCGHEEAIFGEQGAQKMADDYDLALLGKIPLELAIRQHMDAGEPTVVAAPESTSAKKYQSIALSLAAKLAVRKRDFSSKFPNIVVENN